MGKSLELPFCGFFVYNSSYQLGYNLDQIFSIYTIVVFDQNFST